MSELMVLNDILQTLAIPAADFISPILGDIAKDIGKDKVKDWLENYFDKKFPENKQQLLLKALLKALRDLLRPFQDELLDNGLNEEQARILIPQIKQFLDSPEIKTAIRLAFTESDSPVDAKLLAEGWQQLPTASLLPKDFSWSRIAGRFSRSVRHLREEDEELSKIVLRQAAQEEAQASRQIAGLAPEFDLEGYRESLLEFHGNLKLELLDAIGSAYRVKLWSVFVPQTVRDCQEYIPQLFEIPKEYQQHLHGRGELEDTVLDLSSESVKHRRKNYLDQSPRQVLEVVNDSGIDHLVILGDPGSGKSTLLKSLALEWARIEDVTDRYVRPLPLLIELAAYDRWDCTNRKSFVRYLQDAQTVHQLDQLQLDQMLQRPGGAILLLDGLDEIFEPNRRKAAINDIHRFSNEYPATRIIVTSRVIGYEQRQLADAGFRHFMLQDLDNTQIADFLDRWYSRFVTNPHDRVAKKERLLHSISQPGSIRELAGNPLLLTLMAILNLNNDLPRDRVRLYERASELLLDQWEVERLGLEVEIAYREKAEMLRQLAHYMQGTPSGLKGNIIAGDELQQIFRDYLSAVLKLTDTYQVANRLVVQLRERNFILCHLGADYYAFVHRTMLEYFCASALVYRALDEDLIVEFLKANVYDAHWQDESWHEVLKLIAGMNDRVSVPRVAQIIEYLADSSNLDAESQKLFLAVSCYLEIDVKLRPQRTGDLITVALIELLQSSISNGYDSKVGLTEDSDHIISRAKYFLGHLQLKGDPPDWLKACASRSSDPVVCEKAVQALVRQWKGDYETYHWLRNIAIESNNEFLRKTTIAELAQGWRNEREVFSILKDSACRDGSEMVRESAIKGLATEWSSDPNTLPLLKTRIKEDKSENVRKTLLQELARGWYSTVDVFNLIKEIAEADQNGDMRNEALETLTNHWSEEPSVWLLLKDRVEKDEDKRVLRTIRKKLESNPVDDPEVEETLRKLKRRIGRS